MTGEEIRHSSRSMGSPNSPRKHIFGKIKSVSSRSMRVDAGESSETNGDGYDDTEADSQSVADDTRKKSRKPLAAHLKSDSSHPFSPTLSKEPGEKRRRKKKDKKGANQEEAARNDEDQTLVSSSGTSHNSPESLTIASLKQETETTNSTDDGDNVLMTQKKRAGTPAVVRRNTPSKKDKAIKKEAEKDLEIALEPEVKPHKEKMKDKKDDFDARSPPEEDKCDVRCAIQTLETHKTESTVGEPPDNLTKNVSKESISSGSAGGGLSKGGRSDSLVRSVSAGVANMGRSLSRGITNGSRNSGTHPSVTPTSGTMSPNTNRRSTSPSSTSRSGSTRISFADDDIILKDRVGDSLAESPPARPTMESPLQHRRSTPRTSPVDIPAVPVSGSTAHSPRSGSALSTWIETCSTPSRRVNSMNSISSPSSPQAYILNDASDQSQVKMACNDLTHLSLTAEKQQLLYVFLFRFLFAFCSLVPPFMTGRNKCYNLEMTVVHLESIIDQQRAEIGLHTDSCMVIDGTSS